MWRNTDASSAAWAPSGKYYIIAVLYKKEVTRAPKGFDAWRSLPFDAYEWLWSKSKADKFKEQYGDKMWNAGYQGFQLFYEADDMAYAGCTSADSSWTDEVNKRGSVTKYSGKSNRSCLGGHLYHLVAASRYTLNAWF
jgi:hypothetical protein